MSTKNKNLPRFHIYRPAQKNLIRNCARDIYDNQLTYSELDDMDYWMVYDRKIDFLFTIKNLYEFYNIQPSAENFHFELFGDNKNANRVFH